MMTRTQKSGDRMGRVDVHNHVLPGLDDGCRNLTESLQILTTMQSNGYDRIFCTSHVNTEDLPDLCPTNIVEGVKKLQSAATAAGIAITLKPGGELRLSPDMPENLARLGVPTYGCQNKYVLTDVWGVVWETWATRCIEWLQKRDLKVILAHPERLGVVRKNPAFVKELLAMGVLLQGNLGPIGGGDAPDIVSIAEQNLRDGHYFMVGTDSHRPEGIAVRMKGLQRVEELVGPDTLRTLTETNPATLWTTM